MSELLGERVQVGTEVLQQERSESLGHEYGIHEVVVGHGLPRQGLKLDDGEDGAIVDKVVGGSGGVEAHDGKRRVESRGGAETLCKSGGLFPSTTVGLIYVLYISCSPFSKPFFAYQEHLTSCWRLSQLLEPSDRSASI